MIFRFSRIAKFLAALKAVCLMTTRGHVEVLLTITKGLHLSDPDNYCHRFFMLKNCLYSPEIWTILCQVLHLNTGRHGALSNLNKNWEGNQKH